MILGFWSCNSSKDFGFDGMGRKDSKKGADDSYDRDESQIGKNSGTLSDLAGIASHDPKGEGLPGL
jgi:hypothetical protein